MCVCVCVCVCVEWHLIFVGRVVVVERELVDAPGGNPGANGWFR